MLEQLMDLVKNFGKDTVVENPAIPNEQNQEVLADATKTITSGFQNVLAGGGLQNILDLFKGSNGAGSLQKNPMVTMMVGHFISKLVGKYNLSPASASNVANNLIPNVLNGVITETNNTQNPGFTLDGLIGSLTGGGGGGTQLQDLLNQFTGGTAGNNGGGGFDIQDIIGSFTQKAQDSFQPENQSSGGGLMDMIKGFLSK